MNSRERILATIHGQTVDRFPVWLKFGYAYRAAQPEPHCGKDKFELVKETGCDLMTSNGVSVSSENPNVTIRDASGGDVDRTVFETPDGELVSEATYNPAAEATHPTRYAVNNEEELKALRWVYTDNSYEVDPDEAGEVEKKQGDYEKRHIFTRDSAGSSPLMKMVRHLAGPTTTYYLLQDCPALFREVIDLMHRDRVRELEAKLPAVSADAMWMIEDTSTTFVSPDLFREFCVPHLRKYGNMMLEHDIIPVHHMCGTLNALLEDIDKLPALINEAFTTPPVGDCTLAEGRTRMPSKTLMGGTNATLLTRSVDEVEETLEEDLENCPDLRKIFVTSAGVLPPPVSVEKAKRLVEMMKRVGRRWCGGETAT